MLDICYYNSQVKEELDGARDYIQKAIKCKAERPDRASTFAKMSEGELGHADLLIKMFEDDYKQLKTDDSIYPQLRSSLLDMYVESVAKIKYMHNIYASK